MFNKSTKERKMQTCYECGEDLILNSNHINECSNKNCETHTNKFDSFDKICDSWDRW